MSSIVAILNTYSPASGRNIAQVVIRSDGSCALHGDAAMARFAVGKLVNSRLPEHAADPEPKPTRGRPRKVR